MKGAAAEKTGKSYAVQSLPDGVQGELGMQLHKRLCSKCGSREVYQDLKNMDWCEECINQFVMECNNE